MVLCCRIQCRRQFRCLRLRFFLLPENWVGKPSTTSRIMWPGLVVHLMTPVDFLLQSHSGSGLVQGKQASFLLHEWRRRSPFFFWNLLPCVVCLLLCGVNLAFGSKWTFDKRLSTPSITPGLSERSCRLLLGLARLFRRSVTELSSPRLRSVHLPFITCKTSEMFIHECVYLHLFYGERTCPRKSIHDTCICQIDMITVKRCIRCNQTFKKEN